MYCIVATKGKMMGFGHIACTYFVYIMPSCLKHYSVCHELNTTDASRSRSIGGEIVVDVGRSRSTCHGHNAYIYYHAMNIVIIICFSINCPKEICLSTVCHAKREKPQVRIMAPGSTFSLL